MELVFPVMALYVLTGQFVQLVALAEDPYVPTGHTTQTPEPLTKLPAGHTVQLPELFEPVGDVEPVAQFKQSDKLFFPVRAL